MFLGQQQLLAAFAAASSTSSPASSTSPLVSVFFAASSSTTSSTYIVLIWNQRYRHSIIALSQGDNGDDEATATATATCAASCMTRPKTHTYIYTHATHLHTLMSVASVYVMQNSWQLCHNDSVGAMHRATLQLCSNFLHLPQLPLSLTHSLLLSLSFSLFLLLLLLLLLHWQQTTRNFYARFFAAACERSFNIIMPRRVAAASATWLRLISTVPHTHTQKVCRPNRVWWWSPAWLRVYQSAISHD